MNEKATFSVRFTLSPETDLPDATNYMPASEDDIVEEDVLWDLWDLTAKDKRGPSELLCEVELCQAYGLIEPPDIRAVQKLFLEALAPLDSVDIDWSSLVNLKKEYESDKKGYGKLLKAIQFRVSESEHCGNDLKYDQDTFQE